MLNNNQYQTIVGVIDDEFDETITNLMREGWFTSGNISTQFDQYGRVIGVQPMCKFDQ